MASRASKKWLVFFQNFFNKLNFIWKFVEKCVFSLMEWNMPRTALTFKNYHFRKCNGFFENPERRFFGHLSWKEKRKITKKENFFLKFFEKCFEKFFEKYFFNWKFTFSRFFECVLCMDLDKWCECFLLLKDRGNARNKRGNHTENKWAKNLGVPRPQKKISPCENKAI